METHRLRPNMTLALVGFAVLFGILLACARTLQADRAGFFSVSGSSFIFPTREAAGDLPKDQAAAIPAKNEPAVSPTPDDPHPLEPVRENTDQYVVQAGDSLNEIAREHGVSMQQLIQANNLQNPDHVEVGQVLVIPAPRPEGQGPDFKIIPDSELVYSPGNAGFDAAAFIQSQGGYLSWYSENIEGTTLSGTQIVQRVALEFSVNPRLLLAVLEYQSGWVTQAQPRNGTDKFPIGIREQWRKGLYYQLTWAANNLNRGYYMWRVGGASNWLTADDAVVPVAPTINAGTAGVQNMFAGLYGSQEWRQIVGEDGFITTYQQLFGYPFNYAYEPLLPDNLQQPTLQLPFEPGTEWAFTGGPHGGWGSGSAWAALDFAPPGSALGCVLSDDWVVALADGVILRTGNGAVIQDLDGDGLEQTGWTLLYMHVESRNRIQPGSVVRAGDRIGHPSCEGGVSTGTHVHIARRYNGEWIPADQKIPFVLDGWTSSGDGYEYNGYLQKDGESVEAYAGRSPGNGIGR